jgi:AcrR family transcriptional regulator
MSACGPASGCPVALLDADVWIIWRPPYLVDVLVWIMAGAVQACWEVDVAEEGGVLQHLAAPGPGGKPARGRRGRPRDPSVDAAIRAATMELLGEAGYAQLTMEQVAARAKVSKSSVYLRWPNKVALVADALQHRARAVPEVPDTGSLPGDMRAFLGALLRSRTAASQTLQAVSGEIASNPELRMAWHRGLAGMLTGCLRTIITRAADRGELAEGSDVDLLSQLPLSLLQNWRLEHQQDPDEVVVERIVAQFYTPTRQGP